MKNRRNRYGYKVCYCEEESSTPGKKRYVRHFKTYTYKQAVQAMDGYIRYPPTAREDGHVLNNPKWVIIPISRDEVKSGIWREVPF